ncbi:bifunctional glutamate N-acetyltransferase/amino-acid acetyltransferase ArgJ [Alkalicoccus halolimnae]|uniref:Arginine biosynthesis bifunctional protein ArgJ n=1 Tax=Alkalicoccus halolimnae TaxID=1667239 RepID=A0A5C7FIQ6_9BACI|nr:bifunctional glutamate N-acetyltransferase/amino-acid acetyltransferase ArgJ [Alkalicoccus halolimnae]TXF87207.1 bifunctional glutamate N-acetyltransferase/amino-acid acetyltransferase ArgJ [Alkalicoccus halolimnae]
MLVGQETEISIIHDGHVTSAEGFYAGGVHCGLRRKKLDFGWLFSSVPAAAAAVYTKNSFQAAPLKVTKDSISKEHKLQALVINSANANACTGETGMVNALNMRKQAADAMGLGEHLVGVSSTGLIGVQLPMDKIEKGMMSINPAAVDPEAFEQAILTTDTKTKHTAVEILIDGKPIIIGGAAKGSGMIHPNMATMLAYMTTDADVEADALQHLLSRATDKTYNMITVDGDSSTNDTVVALANGKKGNHPLSPSHPEWEKFSEAFRLVSEILAKKIAGDGEGATKLIEVMVKGAATSDSAGKIAKAVISSNLVKTAVYGADPNWGRVVCAVGYSEEPVEPDSVDVFLGDIQVVENGLPSEFSEQEGISYLDQQEISVVVDLKQGDGKATAWGCDLTYEYVKINASYRT